MHISLELEPSDIERPHGALAPAERRVACMAEGGIAVARQAPGILPGPGGPGDILRACSAGPSGRGPRGG